MLPYLFVSTCVFPEDLTCIAATWLQIHPCRWLGSNSEEVRLWVIRYAGKQGDVTLSVIMLPCHDLYQCHIPRLCSAQRSGLKWTWPDSLPLLRSDNMSSSVDFPAQNIKTHAGAWDTWSDRREF